MLFDGRTALVALMSSAFFCCGGSSSETPPPLEPNALNLHYSRAATTLGDEAELPAVEPSGKAQPRDVPEDEDDRPVVAPRTWGGEKPPPGTPLK
jgi:hypothetical protein